MKTKMRWEHHQDTTDLIEINKHIARTSEGYWFWDETESWSHGPYATLKECREALRKYEP